MFRLAFVITIVLMIASCGSLEFTKEEQQVVAGNVRQSLNDYYADISKSGLTAELRWLDSSDKFFWVPPGYTASISYDSVVKFIRQNAPLFQKIINKWDTLHITPLTKDLAAYTGKLHSAMTDTSGRTVTYSLIETGAMVKRKDGWKLLYGQTALLP